MNCVRMLERSASGLMLFAIGNGLFAQPATFSRTDIFAGQQPYAIATGDFNNDGKADLAVGTTSSPFSITIFLGNGDGTFTTGASYFPAGAPLSIVAADVNHDGRTDLIYADTQTYRVLLGNGDGTFSAGPSHAIGAGNYPQGIAVGDFNGDGKPDIATANFMSGDLSVYLGNGDGSFGAEQRFPAGTQPYAVVTGDFNNDGKLDLAAPNFGSNNISVLLGNGDGTFQSAMNLPVGAGPVSAVAADLNFDGNLDLVVANFNSSPGTVSVLLGQGNGTFQPAVSYPVQIPSGLAVADFNGDGKVDLAVTRYSASEVAVLLGKGDGTFQAAVDLPFAPNSWPQGIVTGDFNSDGKPDLATADYLSNNASILINTTSFGITLAVSPNSGSGAAHTFAFTFSDPGGVANIVSTQMDFSATLASAGACYLKYVRSSNALYLANDAGSFTTFLTVGSPGMAQNSQCAVDAGASSMSALGNTLTLNLALSFQASFGGLKNIFMEEQNTTQDSGFAQRGSWTVTGASSQPDFSLGLSPGSQTVAAGGSTSYTVTVTGSNGFGGTVSFAASSLPAGATPSFNPTTVTGSGSTTLTINTNSGATNGSFSIQTTGTSGALSHNAGATLNITGGIGPSPPSVVSVTPGSGSGSSQVFAFAFSDPNGAANIVSTQIDVNATLTAGGACYLYFGRASSSIQLANDAGSFGGALTIGSPGTQQNSQCTVDAGASSVSMVGNTLTVNLALSFKAAFAGAKNVYAEVQNATLDSGWAQPGTWTVTTVAGPQPDFSLSMSPGSQTVAAGGSTSYMVTVTGVNGFGGTVSFSTSLLPAGASGSFSPPTVVGSGSTTLTINTMSNATTGSFGLTVTGTSAALSHNAGATLNITGGSGPSPPVAVSVAPNTGSGSAQVFAFAFSDSNGAANIVSTQMDVNATLTAAGACYLYFGRASNSIQLANDAGSFGAALTIGSPGTQQNSQCMVDAGASFISMVGNTLTVNLALSFKAAFAGAKNVYLEAQNATLDSGWAQLGTWTVTTVSGPQPDFSLGMSPPSQTLAAGGSTAYTVTATAINGFSGTVNFSVSALPVGVSGSFNPTSVTGSGSSTLTINTTSGASTGTFGVTATGTSGALSHTAGATLNITGGSGPAMPSAVSVSPNMGSGSSQVFAFTFSDANGAADIVSTQMDVNSTLTAAGACYLYFGRASSSIQLANDAGSFGGAMTIGSPGTLQNSQCTVDTGASSVMMSGNTLTVNLALSFKAAFVGPKNVYMEAQNATLDSGWAQLGTWTVSTTSGPTPDFSISMSPSSRTVVAGGTTTYTVTATAVNGFSGTVTFSMSLLPAGASGSFNPPSVAGSGSTTLTINTAPDATSGNYGITATGTSGSLNHSGNASLIIAAGGASPPTAVSVSPSAGSGSTQIFAFAFSDAGGAANIVSTQMDVNATLTAAGACYLFFNRPANAIQLSNDGGSFGAALNIGSPGTQQNSQCTVDAGASSVSMVGNTLTVNLALSFKPAFTGAKNVFMEAQNSTLDSGWAQRGTWTVP